MKRNVLIEHIGIVQMECSEEGCQKHFEECKRCSKGICTISFQELSQLSSELGKTMVVQEHWNALRRLLDW